MLVNWYVDAHYFWLLKCQSVNLFLTSKWFVSNAFLHDFMHSITNAAVNRPDKGPWEIMHFLMKH